jgi:hypothetical protein
MPGTLWLGKYVLQVLISGIHTPVKHCRTLGPYQEKGLYRDKQWKSELRVTISVRFPSSLTASPPQKYPTSLSV